MSGSHGAAGGSARRRAGSGALDDERLAGLDDAGALAGLRVRVPVRVVRVVLGRQRAVLRRQVRRRAVRVPSQQLVRQRARPTGAHQPSLRVHLVCLEPLPFVAVFVGGTCKVHAKMKSAAFSESASESYGSPAKRKCSAAAVALATMLAFRLSRVVILIMLQNKLKMKVNN